MTKHKISLIWKIRKQYSKEFRMLEYTAFALVSFNSWSRFGPFLPFFKILHLNHHQWFVEESCKLLSSAKSLQKVKYHLLQHTSFTYTKNKGGLDKDPYGTFVYKVLIDEYQLRRKVCFVCTFNIRFPNFCAAIY